MLEPTESPGTEATGSGGPRVVFHVIDSLAIGGAERMAVDIANGLAARGWQVHLVATRGLGPLAAEVVCDVRLHDLARRSRFDLAGLRRFRALVRRLGPLVVHAHGWTSLQFATAGLLATRRAPPLVFHDHRPSGLDQLSWTYRAAAWPLVRAHLAVDEVLLVHPLPTRHRSVRAVVPNGTPLARFHRKSAYEVGRPARLAVVANLRPQKGHLLLFDALARLTAQGVDVRLDLLGATTDREHVAVCVARLDALGLASAVRILGARDDVGTLLAGYDLGVLSSSTESGPVALIEYLAAGLPFVVTEVGEVPRSLPVELQRWLVAPGDATAMADRIAEGLALSSGDRRVLADVGVQFVHDNLSIERTVSGIEAVYADLLDR